MDHNPATLRENCGNLIANDSVEETPAKLANKDTVLTKVDEAANKSEIWKCKKEQIARKLRIQLSIDQYNLQTAQIIQASPHEYQPLIFNHGQLYSNQAHQLLVMQAQYGHESQILHYWVPQYLFYCFYKGQIIPLNP